MKNILNIDNGIPTLLSNVDDGTNTLYINDELVPSSEWTGTGYYTFTSGGLTFTIQKIRDDSGNIMLQLIEQSGGTSYRLIKYISNADKYYSIEDPAETDLVDGDYLPFYDTSAGRKKKTLWSNIVDKIKSLFVQKSGDTMTGALTFSTTQGIKFEGEQSTWPVIKFVNGDLYGNGIVIGGGGLTIIGGGESADVIAAGKTGDSESLYLTNDGNVTVVTNLQGGDVSTGKTFIFGANGNFDAPGIIKEAGIALAKVTEAIKNITRSGTTFTATRCDGTTFQFSQQDNNDLPKLGVYYGSSYDLNNIRAGMALINGQTGHNPFTDVAYFMSFNVASSTYCTQLCIPYNVNILRSSGFAIRNWNDSGWSPWTYFTQNSNASSRRVKENIRNMTDTEAQKLLDVKIVKFDYKKNWCGGAKNQSGVIAEDTIEIIPEVVKVDENYDPNLPLGDNYNYPPEVDYRKFIPYLIKMVQIQQKEINGLKAEIKALKEG